MGIWPVNYQEGKRIHKSQDKNNQVRQLEIYNYFSSDKFLTVFLIEDNYEIFSLETKYRWFIVKILLEPIDQWFSTPLECKLFAKQAQSNSYTCSFHWLPTSDFSKLIPVTLNQVPSFKIMYHEHMVLKTF